MEDFVSFEIAKKLKKKGFREDCIAYYHINGELLYNRDKYRGGDYKSLLKSYNSLPKNPIGCEQIDAPTISQVLKWLRKEKEIDIILEPIFLYNENNREREYGIKIYAPQLNKPTHLDYFKKWEKGTVAGIDYVLDNLI